MTTTIFAAPYSLDATGFYFTSPEAYEDQATGHIDRFGQPVEEYELDFIDGEGSALFHALKVTQATVGEFFSVLNDLTEDQQAALFYLVGERGMTMKAAMNVVDDVHMVGQSATDYAAELFDELHPDLPQTVRMYVDTDAWGRDLLLNGDIAEFDYEGTTYTVANASEL